MLNKKEKYIPTRKFGMTLPKFIRRKKNMYPLLDYTANLQLVFSYYKVIKTYTGPCVEVKRSSDNSTQVFAFINGYIDRSGIVNFCGAGDGYVTTWYNQVSGGNNAVQTTSSKQPKIVSSGVFESNGLLGIPANATYMSVTSYTGIEISDNFALYANFYLNVNNIDSRVCMKSFASGISYTISPRSGLYVQNYIHNGTGYQSINHSGLTAGNHKNHLSFKASENPDLVATFDGTAQSSEVGGSISVDNRVLHLFGNTSSETNDGNIKTIIIANDISVNYNILSSY